MIKTQGKIKQIKPGFDRWLLIASIILSVVMIAIAVFSIVFLSNSLLKAFILQEDSESDLKFDLEGYEQILKDLNRTPTTAP